MNYAKEFELDSLGDSCAAVNKARDAGKSDELLSLLEKKFAGRCETLEEIREYVNSHENNLLREIGLAPDGKPLDEKKFKVFVRINCITDFEVNAKNPEDAREIANEIVWEDPGNCFINIHRDEIETAVPVAYEEPESFETKDYGPSDEERQEFKNALIGHPLLALCRIEKDSCGLSEVSETQLFLTMEEAFEQMTKEFCEKYDKKVGVDLQYYQTPEDGQNVCYVSDMDGSETRWMIKDAPVRI